MPLSLFLYFNALESAPFENTVKCRTQLECFSSKVVLRGHIYPKLFSAKSSFSGQHNPYLLQRVTVDRFSINHDETKKKKKMPGLIQSCTSVVSEGFIISPKTGRNFFFQDQRGRSRVAEIGPSCPLRQPFRTQDLHHLEPLRNYSGGDKINT